MTHPAEKIDLQAKVEARDLIAAAYETGFRAGMSFGQPWPDMDDWLALTADQYAKEAPAPPQPVWSDADVRAAALAIAEALMAQGAANTVRARSGLFVSINEHGFHCDDLARAALSAAPVSGAGGWRPISEAPKDRPIYVLGRAWGKPDGHWILTRGLWIEEGWGGPGYYSLFDGVHLSHAELWAPDTLPPLPPQTPAPAPNREEAPPIASAPQGRGE